MALPWLGEKLVVFAQQYFEFTKGHHRQITNGQNIGNNSQYFKHNQPFPLRYCAELKNNYNSSKFSKICETFLNVWFYFLVFIDTYIQIKCENIVVQNQLSRKGQFTFCNSRLIKPVWVYHVSLKTYHTYQMIKYTNSNQLLKKYIKNKIQF